MSKFTHTVATAGLLASLAGASLVTAGAASAAPAGGLPNLVISADRGSCTVSVTNRGSTAAIGAAIFTSNFGGITSPAEDLAPGAIRNVRYLDCTGLPALAFTYDTNGDSNPFDNVTLF